MEHLPPRSPDEEPHGPDHDHLDPGEIDLTGATRQDDALADVIGDAIGEATAEGGTGEVPDWGARTLARALANERDDPLSGALHHFAVTGRADPEAIARELADLYQATTDKQTREWINWLGTYVIRMPDNAEATEQADSPTDNAPDLATAPEAFGAHLRHAFTEADARGEAITDETARDLARLLAIFLNPDSEMARFADTGDANPVLLSQECQAVRRLTDHLPGASEWITRFEQHLAARSDLGRPAPPSPDAPQPDGGDRAPGSPGVAQGIREHGDAFRAYLTLPDVEPDRPDLLQTFHEFYVGTFTSMEALLDELTEIRDWQRAINEVAHREGFEEFVTLEQAKIEAMARATWDIVEVGGKLYVFSK
jgi:hypothetical protein